MKTHPIRHFLAAVAGCACFAFLLGALGPTLDDIEEVRAAQASTADAEAAARKAARRLAAIEAVCGPNASVIEQDDQSVRCVTKRGFKTQLTAKVQL